MVGSSCDAESEVFLPHRAQDVKEHSRFGAPVPRLLQTDGDAKAWLR